ncbi:hypothetical protein WOLCODRAFT_158855 [Wolfiporia cocos MD-104 SS10]|uniref:Uncharacterized protein n=1 Tax=Wolfiporia cocos (strain MD-104) TaxID=742152 RepID=A0A2H3JKH0_WOLCO|nr:hypothetical protein WOLCODRAFT_158855 [Wolfiporia cocos MD-104 SS10]
MAEHHYLTHLDNFNITLFNSTHELHHCFPIPQLRLFSEFDHKLRTRHFTKHNESIPGSYTLFRSLWNADPQCAYQFSGYDMLTGAITIAGKPIPVDLLVPRTEPQLHVVSKYSTHQEEVVEGILWELNVLPENSLTDLFRSPVALHVVMAEAVVKELGMEGMGEEQPRPSTPTAELPIGDIELKNELVDFEWGSGVI